MICTSPSPLRATPRARAAAWSDAELVQACIGGDERGWNELLDRFGRLVYSICRRHGLDEADADDVYQQVFAIAYRKLGNLRDPSRLPAWLISTTLRECRRNRRWLPRRESLDDCVTAAESPPEEVALWERRQLVRQALRQLGGQGARLLTALFSCTGRPNYRLIAQELGMKPGSIGPTRARAFRTLEKILAELGLDRIGAEAPAPRLLRLAG